LAAPSEPSNLTLLLRQWGEGNSGVENDLFLILEPDLRRIASSLLRREQPGRSLQTVDLVNEVYIRLSKAREQDWRDRQHFFAFIARMMRRHLIDRARARPKAQAVGLEGLEAILPATRNDLDLAITIDRLLKEMEIVNPVWCTIVELKFFMGLTDAATAKVLKRKERTVQRMWSDARIWLFERASGNVVE
jgi:RNA polymerase sigma-70 factor (ECF subfamily)